jgi:hypothetical protein
MAKLSPAVQRAVFIVLNHLKAKHGQPTIAAVGRWVNHERTEAKLARQAEALEAEASDVRRRLGRQLRAR